MENRSPSGRDIVEWSGIVELRKVGSATKVEFPGALGNPGKRRKSRMRIIPVNGEPNLTCVRLGYCRNKAPGVF